jgi:hypothetical protein
VSAAAWNIKTQKSHEWNLSVQKAIFLKSALTLSYVGNRVVDLVGGTDYNAVRPGNYQNLQASKPYPAFGGISLQTNQGRSWYNSAQLKWERRFNSGLSFTTAYAFGKFLVDKQTNTPFSPEGYDRGRSIDDRTHILTINSIYQLPFGKGRRFVSNIHPLANGILGGWEFSGIYSFVSGSPLTISVLGAPLGNGYGTRANLIGDPRVSNPSANLWFNPRAFATPPPLQFGNAGTGLLDGPGRHGFDMGLMKNFNFTEARYLQFRWEMFNAMNEVNLGNPVVTIGLATTGQIVGAGEARQMQLGLKFVW